MCCGDSRKAVTQQVMNQPAPAAAPMPVPPTYNSPAAAWSSVRLRYLQQSPIRVGGPVTGKHYDFSGAQPVMPVESRDAEALLRTGFFTRE
jgi:hypothetical protein